MMMMMLSSEQLYQKWNNLSYHLNGFVRIDSDHPLDWHIGYENIDQKSLLLVSNVEPPNVSSSKSIQVTEGKRVDGKWAIVFKLIRGEQEDVFLRLCLDLIESSRNQSNDENGMEFVAHRYRQWARLMESEHFGILGETLRKGLLGEVHFLQQRILNGTSLFDAVNGWMGPEGADQDFIYSDGWYEVKTVGMGAKTVSISSLEQLDAHLPGELILYFIDKTAKSDPKGFTLNSKISQVREQLETHYVAYELFKEKLLRYGYMELPEYDKQFYRLGGARKYCVDQYFPRLVKDNVPVQVVNAEYKLSIQAIEQWKVE
jgi:hypothetical protein